MSPHQTLISRFFLLAAAAAVPTFGCSNGHTTPRAAIDHPTADVRVETLVARDDPGWFYAVGRVKNLRESTVSSRAMGRVLAVKAKAGDRVKKGQLLVRIDNRDAQGRVDQARGALAQAEAARVIARQMLDRFEALRAADSASQARYDKAVFDLSSAEGAVAQARGALGTAASYLKDYLVLAPFDGVVVDTQIEEGEMAAPGRPLLRVEGESDLEFEATVNGQDVHSTEVGEAVTVELDVGDDQKAARVGQVTEIVPTSDRITHSNLVRIKLEPGEGIRSGAFGRARFARSRAVEGGLLISRDRLVRRGQLVGVYVVDAGDQLRLRLVKDGREAGDEVEILAGLALGDRLVTSDLAGLIDGQPARWVD